MIKKVRCLLENKFIKKHKAKIILIVGLIFSGIAGTSAATIIFASSEVSFDNTTAGAAGMTATTVQEAIDEVAAEASYCPMTGKVMVSQMGVTTVTSGDGLYADSVESGRYIYRGANPNNYICLDTNSSGSCADDDLYRIIAIEADGTLKVIKNTSIATMAWDPGYSGSISGVTSRSSINGTRYSSTSTDYCYVSATSSYYGCKSWGSSTSTYASDGTTNVTVMPWEAGSSTTYTLPTYDAYVNVYLNGGKYLTTSSSGNSDTYQTITGWIASQNSAITSNIVEYLYNVGPLNCSTSEQTTATDVSQEAAYKWKGKVALMNASDYVRASTNSACTGLYAYTQTSCYNNSSTHNWLFNSAYQWTLSPKWNPYANYVWRVTSDGRSEYNNVGAYGNTGVRPVFHLASSITLTGNGTTSSPYRIS